MGVGMGRSRLLGLLVTGAQFLALLDRRRVLQQLEGRRLLRLGVAQNRVAELLEIAGERSRGSVLLPMPASISSASACSASRASAT